MTISSTNISHADRNFDAIAEHFEKKIYGKPKGEIRIAVLWRDIEDWLAKQPKKKCLKVLDVGGGFGQIALKLAQLGHQVTINDISKNMLVKAQEKSKQAGVNTIRFIHCPYQELADRTNEKYDLVMCHAVLEWLEKPVDAIIFFKTMMQETGQLSLCFYNPVSKIYRNLILGNFYNLDKLNNQTFTSDSGSLTPNNPCDIDEVKTWLTQANFKVSLESGIRVFSDYVVQKRGGNEHLAEVIAKELEFSKKTPYKYMGRYFHIMASVQD